MKMMKMKLAAIATTVFAAVPHRAYGQANVKTGCKQYYPNTTTALTCKKDDASDQYVVDNDVWRWKCGQTPGTPCLAAMKGLKDGDADCNTCHLVTYEQKESTDAKCANSKCPAFTRKVYVKVVDDVDATAAFDFALSGVATQRLCPYVCTGFTGDAPVCVEDPAGCVGVIADAVGVAPADTVNQPGSCLVAATNYWTVTVGEAIDCKDDPSMVPGSPTTSVTADDPLAGILEPAGASYDKAFTAAPDPPAAVDPTPADVQVACHKYWVDDGATPPVLHGDLTCTMPDTTTPIFPVAKDVTRWSCGKTLAEPCLAAKASISQPDSGDCNRCYSITYTQDEVTDTAICDGSCPTFNRTVYVKAVDTPVDALNYDLELSGVAMQRICPYVCKGSVAANNNTPVCVEDPAWCKGGLVEEDYVDAGTAGVKQPGSCLDNTDAKNGWKVTRTEIACDDSSAPDGSDTPSPDLADETMPAGTDSFKDPFVPKPITTPTTGPPTGTTIARCHKYWVNDGTSDHPDLTCKKADNTTAQKPVADDVWRWKCGKTLEKPCLAAKKTITAPGDGDCNKCYAITYKQKESEDPACKGKCPAFERKVYVKTVDAPEESAFDFELSGVAMQRICPYVCKGHVPATPVCVVDPAHCDTGIVEDSSVVNGVKHPGSCLDGDVAKWEITAEVIACSETKTDGSYTPTDLTGVTKPDTGSYNKTFATPSNSGSAGGRRATATFAAAAAVGSLAVWLM